MSPDYSSSTSNTLENQFVSLAALFTVIVAGMVLIGWKFDIEMMKGALPTWVSMKANTAVCFILLGVALKLTAHPSKNSRRSIHVARLCSVLVGMTGTLSLAQYIFGWNIGIDQFLFVEPTGALGTSYPGRMAPDTALYFILLSVALWLLSISHMTRWMIFVLMGIGLLLACSIPAVMLAYFTPSLGSYGWFGLTIMAIPTALLFTLLGIAIIVTCWNSSFISWSLSRNNKAALFCSILLLVLVGFNTNRSQFQMIEINRQIVFSETVLSNIETLLIDVITAQSRIRAYVITGDEAFKVSYLQIKADSYDSLDTLHKTVVGYLHQEQQFVEIKTHVDASLQWFQQVVDAWELGMSADARHKRVRHGEWLLDSLRNSFHQIQNKHQQRIQQMEQEEKAISHLSYVILLIGTITSLLIFLTMIVRLNLAMGEQKLVEKKNHRLNQLYAALSQCNQAIVRCINEQELFQQICRDAVNFGGFKMAWIGLKDETSQLVKSVASFGAGTEYLEGIEISIDPNDPKGNDPTGTCIRENKVFWCQDFQHDPATVPWHEREARFSWGSSAALPLLRNGVAVGAFTLYEDDVNAFDAETKDLLVKMATDISFALDNFSREATRINVEHNLKDTEAKFQALVEQSIAGTYIIQDSKLAYVNPRFKEILGYGNDDSLLGMDLLQCVATINQKEFKKYLANFESTSESLQNFLFTALRKDGSHVEVVITGALSTYQNRPAIIGMMQDISDRKVAEQSIQHYADQLQRTFMQMVNLATTLGEMRDPYTAGHERRVAELAVAIGSAMGLNDLQLEGLKVGGYLHDVGKTSIPLEILSKPGKITPMEYEMIKLHPQAGFDVMKDVNFPWPVAQIALQHHERMDGSGYPNGLKGDEILLEARIIAVADVIEAMGSHRPYHPSVGIDAGLDEIERGRGIFYDSVAVDACLDLFRNKGYTLPI